MLPLRFELRGVGHTARSTCTADLLLDAELQTQRSPNVIDPRGCVYIVPFVNHRNIPTAPLPLSFP